MKFELVLNCDLELIETPIWDERLNSLYWTDLFSGDVHLFNPQTGSDKLWKKVGMICSAIPCKNPDQVLCVLENGAHLLSLESGELELLADAEAGNTENRYNDSRVDEAGRLFMSTVSKLYGTADYRPDMLGGFYMLDTDHKTVVPVVEGIQQYNAIVWTGDNRKMYVVDTYNEKLLCFDYSLEKGPMSGPRVALDLSPHGMPDGMCIDSQDNLYIFHWSGRITVWDKDLSMKEEIPFPVEYVCCGGFGGADLSTLYVATSKYCYTPEQLAKNPGAGGLFAAQCTIPGRPDHFFG